MHGDNLITASFQPLRQEHNGKSCARPERKLALNTLIFHAYSKVGEVKVDFSKDVLELVASRKCP